MDCENVLEADDNLNSLIQLEGNFFIMDSETLVSNPFQELQQEAVNEANKKNSMTEKLTIVKNNVCENHFQMAKSSLERQQTGRLKQLHDHANRLRHEVKLLDLDRQRHNVEVKKRLEPERDYSYDEVQIHNTERRLGANIASFYLDKKLKYPMRLRSVKDIRVTPTISKARAKIRTSDLAKHMEEIASPPLERAQTAKTTHSQQTTSNSAAFRRRGSRSAPLHTRNARSGGSSKTLLPAISTENRRTGHRTIRSTKEDRRREIANGEKETNQQQTQQVKFAFENPLKILASSEESANMFARSCSYYPGSTKAVNFGVDSSDEDDDLSEPERIDLRAILFPDEKTSALGVTHSSLSQHQIWALKKAQGPAPKLSTNKKEEEANIINTKINTFLEKLETVKNRRRHNFDSDSSEDEEECNNGNQIRPTTIATQTAAITPRQHAITVSTGTTTDNTIATNTNTIDNTANNKNHANIGDGGRASTSDNLIQSQNTKTDPSDIEGVKKKPSERPHTTGTMAGVIDESPREGLDSMGLPRKYTWRCIRGKHLDGKLRGTYQTEDLVIQALTGVPISNALSTHVPMHSASRAMRHTATFKMHKIVEKLIHDRTKYERHQVEEIKRQMETTEPSETGALLSRRVSKTTMGSQLSR